jgi:hypothetical protein
MSRKLFCPRSFSSSRRLHVNSVWTSVRKTLYYFTVLLFPLPPQISPRPPSNPFSTSTFGSALTATHQPPLQASRLPATLGSSNVAQFPGRPMKVSSKQGLFVKCFLPQSSLPWFSKSLLAPQTLQVRALAYRSVLPTFSISRELLCTLLLSLCIYNEIMHYLVIPMCFNVIQASRGRRRRGAVPRQAYVSISTWIKSLATNA